MRMYNYITSKCIYLRMCIQKVTDTLCDSTYYVALCTESKLIIIFVEKYLNIYVCTCSHDSPEGSKDTGA